MGVIFKASFFEGSRVSGHMLKKAPAPESLKKTHQNSRRAIFKSIVRVFMSACIICSCGPACCGDINEAILGYNVAKVREIIEKDPEVIKKTCDNEGSFPIHLAVKLGSKEIVELLLSNGANVNAKNNRGLTPLHYVAGEGFKDKWEPPGSGGKETKVDYRELAKLLLAHEADVNAQDKYGYTPLHSAADAGNEQVAKILLDKTADINKQDNMGDTPLHVAAYEYKISVVNILLSYKVDVNKKNLYGATPLHYSASHDALDISKLLITNKSDVNAKDMKGKTPLHCAVEERNKEEAILLLENKANVNAVDVNGNTPLHSLLIRRDKDASELLHTIDEESHATKNSKSSPRFNPMTYGSQNVYCRSNYKDMVELLLTNNANVNPKNNEGITPYVMAVRNEHQESAKLLSLHGGKN